jgi:hypothetical protein
VLPSSKFYHRDNAETRESVALSKEVNKARSRGDTTMARALLKYRAKVRGRLQVQKVERDRKRNDMRFIRPLRMPQTPFQRRVTRTGVLEGGRRALPLGNLPPSHLHGIRRKHTSPSIHAKRPWDGDPAADFRRRHQARHERKTRQICPRGRQNPLWYASRAWTHCHGTTGEVLHPHTERKDEDPARLGNHQSTNAAQRKGG